jgi:hypothetical protein
MNELSRLGFTHPARRELAAWVFFLVVPIWLANDISADPDAPMLTTGTEIKWHAPNPAFCLDRAIAAKPVDG